MVIRVNRQHSVYSHKLLLKKLVAIEILQYIQAYYILPDKPNELILEKVSKHKNNWIQHVDWMQKDRLSKLLNNSNHMD